MPDCNSEECQESLDHLADLRDEINELCRRLSDARDRVSSLATIPLPGLLIAGGLAAVDILAAVAIAVGLIFLGPIAGGVVAIIFGLALIALIVVMAISIAITNTKEAIFSLEIDILSKQREFEQAVGDVKRDCEEHCWGDLTTPKC